MGEGVFDSSDSLSSVNPHGMDESVEPNPNEQVELLIGELRKRTAELEEANRELRRVSHYRSLFLARMSHELRTPLTSIIGFSEILLTQEELTDAQRNFCERIQNSAHQLQNSLVQLGELARLESLPELDPPAE